jgi:hypothetical protein
MRIELVAAAWGLQSTDGGASANFRPELIRMSLMSKFLSQIDK